MITLKEATVLRHLTREKRIFFSMLVIVPLAGELNFYPFNDAFRVSFGTPTFFFFLLLLRKIHPVVSGGLVGFLVVEFRILLDFLFRAQEFADAFQSRYPTFFYYVTFALLFYLTKVNRFHHKPVVIGLLGILAEVSASLAELTFQYIAFSSVFTLSDVHKVIVIAIFRSFFVVGFFNLMNLYQTKIKEAEVRKQNLHLLMVTSNLYVEAFQLKKTLQSTEEVTKSSYHLYRQLKSYSTASPLDFPEELCQQALKIAGEIHEIKKDNQRIFAGLSKLISDEQFAEYMDMSELMTIIVQVNRKYADSLGKTIRFVLDIEDCHTHYHAYSILSIVNHVVENAIEAIEDTGVITLSVSKQHRSVLFRIGDNGPGIPHKHLHLIYKPGFTSKYDRDGNPSTGIGLSYVQEMIAGLGGDVNVQTRPHVDGSVFTVRLPEANLVRRT